MNHLAVAGWQQVRALLPQRADYSAMRANPRRDVIAGVTVALVALPLALAFGVSSGLGAGAGLITAIVAGFLAAVFGGSDLQVSGPTGAMTVVLLPIVAQFGVNGVLIVGLIAGVILVGLACARVGRYMRYLPLPVVEGFTLGIAIVIGLQQIPTALGVTAHGERVIIIATDAVRGWLLSPQWAPLIMCLVVVAAMLTVARLSPGVPISLVSVAVVTAIAVAAHIVVPVIGGIPTSLPSATIPAVPWSQLSTFLVPAVAVAALAALESLLSATVADAMTVSKRHDANRELFGQGIANLAVPLFGGVPATAAIARTAVNVRAGARSRLGAITQSVALLLVMVLAARWVSYIPLAALAGVLIATVVKMVDVSNVRAVVSATRGDAVVLLTTALATVVLDLVVAVIIGIAIAGLYALKQVAQSAHMEVESLHEVTVEGDDSDSLGDHVVAYRLDGPLFFGAAHSILLGLADVSDVRVVILRMSHVQAVDVTGARALAEAVTSLEERGITVLLSGVPVDFVRSLEAVGLYTHLQDLHHVFESTPDAISHARKHATRGGHANQ